MSDPRASTPEAAAGHPYASHGHRDVSGGWLRPTVFGAMDGLVSNVSLIAGVGGGGASAHTLVLTGLAGLVAGAFSMATGEFVSVTSQNELVQAEVEVERIELARHPREEALELAAVFERHGVARDLAVRVATEISRNPSGALRMHAQQELGVDPTELPSPWTAAASSMVSFAVGAVIPLVPYLLGAATLAYALALAGVAALVGGGVVGRITDRPVWLGAARQLLLAALAVGVTYAVGRAIGVAAS